MDLTVLKKKINTYRGDAGRLRNIPDDLLPEILFAWEQWTGPVSGFYVAIGVEQRKFAKILGKAKKLKREGHFSGAEFKEIKLEAASGQVMELTPCSGVELIWDGGKVIRFSEVDLLLDFLKKAA